jgi:CRP-like cAMP-binding protein
MSEILLQALSNADIDWMVTTGERIPLSVNDVLITAREAIKNLYLVLEGELVALTPSTPDCPGRELLQFGQGEIIGEGCLLELPLINVTVKAAKPSLVLVLPQATLREKMQRDMCFHAHLIRAIALMLSNRLRTLFEGEEEIRFGANRSVKEALFVFGELWDSDVDWLLATGHLEKMSAGEVLLQARRPVDALYIIMDGRLAISRPEGDFNALTLCLEGLEKSTRSQKVFATIARGGLPGIISFLDFRPLPVTIRAETEALIFAIPRPQLVAKLQEDSGFASRFYRVIAVQVAGLLQTVLQRLGCSSIQFISGDEMDDAVQYDDELNIEALQQVSQGAARFNWMLEQLGVSP